MNTGLGPQHEYYHCPGGPCKGGADSMMYMLNAALPGFMNGQKSAEEGGSFGDVGVIID